MYNIAVNSNQNKKITLFCYLVVTNQSYFIDFGLKLLRYYRIYFMHVSMFFISQPQQHKSKHQSTLKADKKEAVKNDILHICKILSVHVKFSVRHCFNFDIDQLSLLHSTEVA